MGSTNSSPGDANSSLIDHGLTSKMQQNIMILILSSLVEIDLRQRKTEMETFFYLSILFYLLSYVSEKRRTAFFPIFFFEKNKSFL